MVKEKKEMSKAKKIIIAILLILLTIGLGFAIWVVVVLGMVFGLFDRPTLNVSSFNGCPDTASERYVAYVGYADEKELICLYDVDTDSTRTIAVIDPEDYYLVYDPVLKGDTVEYKVRDDDNDFVIYTYHIGSEELEATEPVHDHTYGYDVWNSLTAEIETPEYGTVTLSSSHLDPYYTCTVNGESFPVEVVTSEVDDEASIYSEDCTYENGIIYAKVMYHEDPWSKREGYFADHNQADRAARKEAIVAINPADHSSKIIYKCKTYKERIIGYKDGAVYYYKNGFLIKYNLESRKKETISSFAAGRTLVFAWCKNDLVLLNVDNSYYHTYKVEKVVYEF